jgi:hypothetical protein
MERIHGRRIALADGEQISELEATSSSETSVPMIHVATSKAVAFFIVIAVET